MKIYDVQPEGREEILRDTDARIGRMVKRTLLAIAVALLVAALAQALQADRKPSELETLTESEWTAIILAQESDALNDPDPDQRRLAAMMAHLGREGYRIGYINGLTGCISSEFERRKP